jgi:hypothetical protein
MIRLATIGQTILCVVPSDFTVNLAADPVELPGPLMVPHSAGTVIVGSYTVPSDFDRTSQQYFHVVAGVVTRVASAIQTPIPTIDKMTFTRLLTTVLGDTLAQAILTAPRFMIILASAFNMDYSDVFDETDDGQPGYAKQLVAGGIVTQAQSDAFEAAWPRQ